MPFLDKIQRWAEQRPHDTAVLIAGRRLDWVGLRDTAAGLVADTAPVTTLCEDNSVDFAVKFAAAVAGRRQCAVLDPAWPTPMLADIARRVDTCAFPAQASPDQGLADGPPESTFLIGLTSGTTSVPKAFTRSRRSWQESFDASIEFFGLRQDDVTLAPGPLAASLNLYALAECLYAGSEFQTLDAFDVGAVHAAIAHDRVTRLVLVPTMLRMLSERGMTGCVDASGIRTIICAGSKLDARTLEAARRWAPNATMYEYYGASELSFVSGLGLAPGQAATAGGTGIGKPFPGVAVRILDDDGAVAPDGGYGNIAVRSAMVGDGYLWGDDGQALRSFGSWHTVGDQGYLADGELHILGRRADMILTAGRNVYPHEVELALAAVPGVAAAVAAGMPDDLRGQRVVAGVVPSHGGLTATQLRAGLEDFLSRHKRPLQFYVLSTLPTTDRGKISRNLLLDWIDARDPRVRPLGG
ncbi:MAG: class I adenylate-forming enzyme family protein [Actinomycetes bacterium]